MLKDYDLHPAIDKTKCFRLTPPGSVPREEPPPTDTHWVADLYRWCCEATNTIPKEPSPFDNYLPPGFLVLLGRRSHVKETLFILFRRFSGALDAPLGPLTSNERTTLAEMLLEDVSATCVEGFLNRALRAVSRLAQPQNPDEYLYLVRQRLVEQAAIGGPPIGNESVHVWNLATHIAVREGIAIQENHLNDLHGAVIAQKELEKDLKVALQRSFERYFTPYELPVLLREVLLNEVAKAGYEGKKKKGYATGYISRITDAVSKLLPDLELDPDNSESWKKIFTWRPERDEDEEAEALGFINFHELKLDFLLSSIYQSLTKNGYLHSDQLQLRGLLDYPAYVSLRQDARLQASDPPCNVLDEKTYVQQLFQEKQYGQLETIFEIYPTYWKHLLEQPDFLAHAKELTQFLRTVLQILRDNILRDQDTREVLWKAEIRHALIALIALLSTADRYDDATLQELSHVLTEPPSGDTYLSLALRGHLGLLPKILEAIDQHKHRWSAEARRAMLSGVWTVEDRLFKADILQQAVTCSNPQISKELLRFLERLSADDIKISEETKELFLRPRNYSLLIEFSQAIVLRRFKNIVDYAVRSVRVHPEPLQQLLDFIRNNRTMFNDADLNKLLSIDYAALRYEPTKLKIVLRCLLSNEIRLSDGTPLSCWFPKAKQTPPSNDPNSEEQLTTQWDSLLWGIKDDTKLTNMLLLRISEHKAKLPEPAEQLLMTFILERLKLLDLSDPRQKKLFEDTANLPELLCILLPNHLKALQKESEIPQRRLQLLPGSVRRAAQSFTGLFHPDERFKTPSQEIAFIQKWIHALATPNNGDGNIGSALLDLKSNSDAARFLSENQCWNALFEICYQQIPNTPLPNASPTLTASRCK